VGHLSECSQNKKKRITNGLATVALFIYLQWRAKQFHTDTDTQSVYILMLSIRPDDCLPSPVRTAKLIAAGDGGGVRNRASIDIFIGLIR